MLTQVYTYFDGSDHGESGKRSNTKRLLFVVIVVLVTFTSLAISVAALIVTTVLKGDKNYNCVPCSIIDNAETEQKYREIYRRFKKVNGDNLCCVTGNSQAKDVHPLNVESNKPALKALALQNSANFDGNKIAFAHKSLCHQHTNTRLASNVPRIAKGKMAMLSIDPVHNDPLTEVTHGVELTTNGIKIVHPGVYLVYNSIHFFPDSNRPCKYFAKQSFKSNLLRNCTGLKTSTILMATEHTCCPDCVRDSETGYTGGVFWLERGDIIQVEVTAVGLVHISRAMTYVGVVMMSGSVLD